MFLNGWTKEKVIAHIKKNFKGKSTDYKGDLCLYRGLQDRKCAVGIFIPDNLYNSEMEGKRIVELLQRGSMNTYGLKKVLPLSSSQLMDMQDIHDLSGDDEDIASKLIAYIESL